MLRSLLRGNRLIHLFTNSFLFANLTVKSGKQNILTNQFGSWRTASKITLKGAGNKILFGNRSKLSSVKIYVEGNNNNISISEDCDITKSLIWVKGDNNSFEIGPGCRLNNTEIGMERAYNSIKLANNVYIGGFVQLGFARNNTVLSGIYSNEGKKVIIGSNTIVSDGVIIRNNDSHPIYDESGERINFSKDIFIGNNVWVCSGAALLKGAAIGDNSILGLKSILTTDFGDTINCIIAGSPAKIIKTGIKWELNLPQSEALND